MPSRDLDEEDFDHMRIPLRYRDVCLDRISTEGDRSPHECVKMYLSRLKEMRENGHGILFFGPNGCGKTSAAAFLLREFRKHGQSCVFIRAQQLVRLTFDDPEHFLRPLSDWVRSADVVLVDDIGKEFVGASGFGLSEMEDAIRSMYERKTVLLATSNLSLKEFDDTLKKSTVSLVKGMVYTVEVVGTNQRVEEARNLGPLL